MPRLTHCSHAMRAVDQAQHSLNEPVLPLQTDTEYNATQPSRGSSIVHGANNLSGTYFNYLVGHI
jgi:hypothetical protein